ncbi:ankyrin repeat-containing domain protein [Mycena crocata]|nr:ankyrin repeat-containing domain protein [Mycena crocata]
MSMDYFAQLPPELIALISASLPISCLNALALTCRRLREILQPDLESRITPLLRRTLLHWAAASKPHIIVKLLSPPHPTSLAGEYERFWVETPLHVAAKAGNIETATLLLKAGIDSAVESGQEESQALHLAAMNNDLVMMRLLLEHGAPVDAQWGCDGAGESALHYACAVENRDMVELLLEKGANLEHRGHFGTALGFAVRCAAHNHKTELVELLLKRGAKADVTVPLFVLLDGGPPYPHSANLLYSAMRLRHPGTSNSPMLRRREKEGKGLTRWEGLPLEEGNKRLMALLIAHGASKEATMALIAQYLAPLAKEAQRTEPEYFEIVRQMIEDAENAIPEVLTPDEAKGD